MSHVQFSEMRDPHQLHEIAEVDAMTRVHLQALAMGEPRRLGEKPEFLVSPVRRGVGKGTGVQLHHVGSDPRRGEDLPRLRIDEKTHENAGILQSFHGAGERGVGIGHIQPALGRHFATVLRDETDESGPGLQSDREDLGRVAHLEIQLGVDPPADLEDIGVLDVTAVEPQVDRDRIRPRRLGLVRGGQKRWLRIVSGGIG